MLNKVTGKISDRKGVIKKVPPRLYKSLFVSGESIY